MSPPFGVPFYITVEKSLSLAGGHNIVNVGSLSGLQGYDTLGEISVLCLAAFGVYNLIHSRGDDQ
ncbi:MAG: hydrogen gas-evolving membrane-bound hydrogenase subunit E [Methanolobus sp.]